MGTKYTSQSDTGYNASPPSDDGTAVSSNEVKWSFIKTKLADIVRTFCQDINSAILTHTDESVLDKGVTYTTTAADHKRTINVTAAATISLADAATVATGYIVTVKNSHTAAITVDLATNTDTLDETVDGSISLGVNESVTVVTESTADGYLSSARVLGDDVSFDTVTGDTLTANNSLLLGSDNIYPSVLGTEVATTSGTSVEIDGTVPSWVKKITVNFVGVRTDSNNDFLIQIGDSGGYETSGYLGSSSYTGTATQGASFATTGFEFTKPSAAAILHGSLTITLQNASTFTYSAFGVCGQSDASVAIMTGGSKSLDTVLDRIRITTVGGTDNFDAGAINVLYE